MQRQVTDGYISTEYTMWCGTCHAWVQDGGNTKASFIKRMRGSGWRKTKEYGWRCRDCVDKSKLGYEVEESSP